MPEPGASSMNIFSSLGNRVAEVAQGVHQNLRKTDIGRAFKTLVSKSDITEGALHSLGVKCMALTSKRQSASDSILSATGCSPCSVKSASNQTWAAARPKKDMNQRLHFVSGDALLDHRFATQEKIAQQLIKKFGSDIPSVQDFLATRHTKPSDFLLFETFTHLVGSSDDMEFLKAVSEFRDNPSVKSAREIVKTFIEPTPIDDFGIPVVDKSKKQMNLSSSEERKRLMEAVDACIERYSSDQDDEAKQALSKVFESTENYINHLFVGNMKNHLTNAVKNVTGIQQRAQMVHRTVPSGLA